MAFYAVNSILVWLRMRQKARAKLQDRNEISNFMPDPKRGKVVVE